MADILIAHFVINNAGENNFVVQFVGLAHPNSQAHPKFIEICENNR